MFKGFVCFLVFLFLGMDLVGNYLFNYNFGLVISIGGFDWVMFRDWDYVGNVGGIVVNGS